MFKVAAMILAAALSVFSVIAPVRVSAAGTEGDGTEPQYALSYIVTEQDTGQVLFRQNAQSMADPTLLSRMMCAVVVLEYAPEGKSVSLTDNVVPTESSVSKDGKYKLTAGNSYTVGMLLRAMLLGGADNCASVLAGFVNPNTEYFVTLMNQTAARLEMTDTYFTSPGGSGGSLARTSVSDIAKFYAYALRNAAFRNIVQSEFGHIWDNTAVFNLCTLPFSLKNAYGATVAGGVFLGASQGGAGNAEPSEGNTGGNSSVAPTLSGAPGTMIINITLPPLNDGDGSMRLIVAVQDSATDEQLTALMRSLISDSNSGFRKNRVYKSGDVVATYDVAKQSLSLRAAGDLFLVVPLGTAPAAYIQTVTYSFTGETNPKSPNAPALSPPILEGQQLGSANLLLRDGSQHSLLIYAGNTIQTDNARVNSILNLINSYRPLFIIIAVLLAVELYVLIAVTVSRIRKAVAEHRRQKRGGSGSSGGFGSGALAVLLICFLIMPLLLSGCALSRGTDPGIDHSDTAIFDRLPQGATHKPDLVVTAQPGESGRSALPDTDVSAEAFTPAPTEGPAVTDAATDAPAGSRTATGDATPAPIKSPVATDTGSRTPGPTEAPTERPANAPTERPTKAPTERPTKAPTEAPAGTPAPAPTFDASGIERAVSSVDFNGNGIDDYTDFLLGAKKDAAIHPRYDGRYWGSAYPPDNVGVCADVIWRAFREAGYSLRYMVDRDIRQNTWRYPKIANKQESRDSKIDFRRVRNLRIFFDAYALVLTTDINDVAAWQPGDIVIFNENSHIGIVSDKRNASGQPYIIHNGGQLNREEDYLPGDHKVAAHYRFDASRVPADMLIEWELG